MKYVVICYSVHNKEIASYDGFDNEDDAYNSISSPPISITSIGISS